MKVIFSYIVRLVCYVRPCLKNIRSIIIIVIDNNNEERLKLAGGR